MNIKQKKSGWMQAISEGQVDKALDGIRGMLETWSDQSDQTEAKERFHQFTLLSGRWRGLQQERTLGIIGTAEEKVERNKITHALITFIDQLPDEFPAAEALPASTGTGGRRLGFLAGIAVLAIASTAVIINQINGNEEQPADRGVDITLTETDTLGTPSTTEPDSVPAEVDLWTLEYTIPKVFPIDWNLPPVMCESKWGCLVDEFRPIGWSADDKYFAYMTLPVKEAVEGFALIIRVQNLENNTIEWEYSYGLGESSRNQRNENIGTVWKKYEELFTGKLRKYGIIPSIGERVTFPRVINGKQYEVRLENTKKKDELFGIEVVHTETVFTSIEGLGTQKIYTHTFEKYGPLNTAIIGALISPVKKRAALIKVMEKRGFEGPPNPLSAIVIGWDLNGF